jgi:hypothetical protein
MTSLLLLTGYAGIGLTLIAFYLLVTDHLKATSTHYITLNIAGAVCMLLALGSDVALPLTSVTMVWLLISLFGFYRHHVAVTQ